MQNLSTPQEYKPVLQSRRSEITAWLLAAGLSALLFFFDPEGVFLTGSGLMLVLLGLSAVTISVGNWFDRHTSISIGPEGVAYTNGIGITQFDWKEITRVEMLRRQFGDKIIVSGSDDHFTFQPLGTMSMNEKFAQKVGFEAGDQILETILQYTGLVEVGPRQTEHGYYYSRD